MTGNQIFCLAVVTLLVIGGIGIAWAEASVARRGKKKPPGTKL